MDRPSSPTPIYHRYASQASFPPLLDDQETQEDAQSPNHPLEPAANTPAHDPYRRSSPGNMSNSSIPTSQVGHGGARRHPLANLLTPASSTPTLTSDVDGDSLKHSSNVQHMAGGSSMFGTPEEEKNFNLPNTHSTNSAGGLLAWLAEDEKRRTQVDDGGRGHTGAAGVSGEEGRRVGYIDGLKFLAGLVALNAAFLSITQQEPGAVERSSPLYVTRSANIALQALLLLSGRSLPIPLPHASPLLSLSLLSRPLRFVPPVIVVILLQWGLCSGGHTAIFQQTLGLSEPMWCGITNAAGFFTLLWGLFTQYSFNTAVGQAFGGMLYSVPFFFQSSYFTYLLHIVVSALPSNRYWLYIILACFTWSTFSYFTPTLFGYVIYDMSTMFLPRVRRMPLVQRMLVQAILLGLIVLFEFINPTRNAINSGMAAWNIRDVTQIQFGDTIFVTLLLLWVEITPWAQLVLGNVLVRYLFILTPGFYLLTPAMTYTLVPAVLSHFTNPTNNPGGLFAAWVALLVVMILLSVAFYFAVVYPSVYLSRLFCSFLVSWGPDADPDSFAATDAVTSPRMDGKNQRRIYVEKPFRSFSLVTSAFGTPISSPAPSVRRMRMDRGSESSLRHSVVSTAHPEQRPGSPLIAMTPLSSPEGLTPHASTDELPWNPVPTRDPHSPAPGSPLSHSRKESMEDTASLQAQRRRESWAAEKGTGYARGWTNRVDSSAMQQSSPPPGVHSPLPVRQQSQSPTMQYYTPNPPQSQSPPPLHVPPPAPPKGAAMPQQYAPYYGGTSH